MNALFVLAVSEAERGRWWPDSMLGRFWVAFGVLAQLAFAGRFLIQWIASERAGRSYVPVSFWYLSLVGGVMLLAYAVFWKQDLVLTLGQLFGGIVYVRNLMLLEKEKKATAQAAQTARPPE